jgi:alginate O-acetyltransferase complex protein AlgI
VVPVQFCSYVFLGFFAAVFLVYWALPWRQARVWLLLTASFAFYASWNHWLAVLVFATSVLDYALARWMDASATPRLRRLMLGASLLVNLGLLGYFKYANFFLHSLEDALRAAGVSYSLPVLQVLVPIGISFYTFEAINYTIDVFRRKIPAERNLGHFLLFITFFPHLVAGPIVRARDFLPQVRRPKRWSWGRFHLGGQFILMGLFKKLVIADHMAQFADPVFADPARFGTGSLWLAALAYALQVYGDFSGYTDIAIGAAHMLGYKLARNFMLPFLAPNIAEFWRRWHISLSSWIRDYLYIPLGGSRGSRWRTYFNLLVTMTISGLWHGANWPFVVFGLIQAAYLIIQRTFREVCERLPLLNRLLRTRVGTAGRIGLTFLCFVCSVVIFRAATLSLGASMLLGMVRPHEGAAAALDPSPVWECLAVVFVCHWLGQGDRWKRIRDRLPSPVRGLAYAGLAALILLLAPVAGRTFIYFQF